MGWHTPWTRALVCLTHWGRVTHIRVGKLTIIVSDNGLSPGRRQAIIWTNVGILLIRLLGTNFSEILIGIETFSFKKMYLKMSSAKWRPFCLGLNVLTVSPDFGVNSNIMLSIQHRNYICMGEHPAIQRLNYTNLSSCICKHFLPHSACEHFSIKLLQQMVRLSLNYQHLKLLSHAKYICNRSPVWITIC